MALPAFYITYTSPGLGDGDTGILLGARSDQWPHVLGDWHLVCTLMGVRIVS